MKQTIKGVAVSSAVLTTLVTALWQVARPAEIRAQEWDECVDYHDICGVETTRTCLFWIFFCRTDTELIYFGEIHN